MANHPNRSKVKTEASNPQPEDVIALRRKYDLTQSEAARHWFVTLNTVQKWEAPTDSVSSRRVHPLMWWAMQRILKGEKK